MSINSSDPIPAKAMRIRRMNNWISEAESPSSPKFSMVLVPCLSLIGFYLLTQFVDNGPLPWIGRLCGAIGFVILQPGLILIIYFRLQRRINSLVNVVRDLEDRLSLHESQRNEP